MDLCWKTSHKVVVVIIVDVADGGCMSIVFDVAEAVKDMVGVWDVISNMVVVGLGSS